MDLNTIIKLIDAGYTKEEISKFDNTPTTPVITPTATEVTPTATDDPEIADSPSTPLAVPEESPAVVRGGGASSGSVNSIEVVENQIKDLTTMIKDLRGVVAKSISMPAPTSNLENAIKITNDIINRKV